MKTAVKTLDILEELLKMEGQPASVSEIADITGFNVSTVHSILSDLVSRGLVSQQERRGKYCLGLRFIEYSTAVEQRLRIKQIAVPLMGQLSKLLGECINLAVKDGIYGVLVATIDPRHPFSTWERKTNKLSMHSTGVGKILFASFSEEEKIRYLKNNQLKRFTPKTITDMHLLNRQLEQITRDGVAYDNEETVPGVRNLATAIRNGNGNTIAALGIIGPVNRMLDTKIEDFVVELKICAEDISRALG